VVYPVTPIMQPESGIGWCPASGDFRPPVSRIETRLGKTHYCDFEPLSWVVLFVMHDTAGADN
jgi:hypothetical protein